jgi:predicted 2-oxoglutarate/Fe(II)-dependent dioxygenase YbiX
MRTARRVGASAGIVVGQNTGMPTSRSRCAGAPPRGPLFLQPGFLSAATCRTLCDAVAQSSLQPSVIVDGPAGSREAYGVRRSKSIAVEQPVMLRIKRRVRSLKTDLEKLFEQPLGDVQEPSFLRYDAGDFFIPHVDNPPFDAGLDEDIRSRRVAVVVYLNDEFQGGELKLYCLEPKPTWDDFCFTVKPRAGLVVAFRSTIMHEVTRVTSGVRYSVATWFTAPR